MDNVYKRVVYHPRKLGYIKIQKNYVNLLFHIVLIDSNYHCGQEVYQCISLSVNTVYQRISVSVKRVSISVLCIGYTAHAQ